MATSKSCKSRRRACEGILCPSCGTRVTLSCIGCAMHFMCSLVKVFFFLNKCIFPGSFFFAGAGGSKQQRNNKSNNKRKCWINVGFSGNYYFFVLSIGCCNSYSKKLYVLAVLGVTDVVGWADNSVAIVTASSVETSFFRPTDSWSDAFIDIFWFNLK